SGRNEAVSYEPVKWRLAPGRPSTRIAASLVACSPTAPVASTPARSSVRRERSVRRGRMPRTDLSRRTLLRAGVLATGAVGLHATSEAAIRVLGLPGARRHFTGSYETASFRPE